MSINRQYEELRAQYRAYKMRVIAASPTSDTDALEDAAVEIPRLERQLLDFCLSNGRDLEDLREFFRDVDKDALPVGSMPG